MPIAISTAWLAQGSDFQTLSPGSPLSLVVARIALGGSNDSGIGSGLILARIALSARTGADKWKPIAIDDAVEPFEQRSVFFSGKVKFMTCR
jgi:hypothetical protein